MNDNKSHNFKSYLELDEHELQTLNLNDTHAKLMPGEVLIAEAQNVVMFNPMADQKPGGHLYGVLSVTNFKLSFIRADSKQSDVSNYQQNLLLGENEVCLSAIDVVYQIGDRKRRLSPGQSVSGKVKGLQIACKNMRVLSFNFKVSAVDNGKSIANALLHHAFPKRHQLLFAYDFKEEYYSSNYSSSTVKFDHVRDWKREMERTHSQNWRISIGNQNFFLSYGLPQTVIVPTSVTETQLSIAARHFRNSYFPVWVWSADNGAALVRMGELLPTIQDRTQENVMLENVRKSHPKMTQPTVMDLSKECPSPRDIQHSYQRLRDLCTPETVRQFWIQDGKLYSALENSRWLQYVSVSLGKSVSAAEQLSNGITVVLQEDNGQDMCCVISCITQLILDSHWRTINGFQSLVQKEWVALGHPFANRLGHIVKHDIEQSPLFLLFLDCVWQLLQQYPMAFEFTETYLTTLWDSAHISIFDTFLFNCEHDRLIASRDHVNPVILRSTWDWGEQFPDKEKELFNNPLYDEKYKKRLEPQHKIAFQELWSQCYFRWIPLLEIPGGGKPQIDLHNRLVKSEIQSLRDCLSKGEFNGDATMNGQRDEQFELRMKVNSFFPFSNNSSQISALQGVLTLNSTLLSGDGMLDSQSIINAPD
ncbi:uncharacterized protein CBL_12709 [Carabus blaptoides fortunei]